MNNPMKTLTKREWCLWIGSLGMTMPMSVWSTITWLKNPSKENGNEVEIQKHDMYGFISWKKRELRQA